MEYNMELFIFAFLWIAYFVIHSVLASHRVKNILVDRWISKKYYRLVFNAIALISLLPIVYVYLGIESGLLFDASIASYMGLSMAVFGLGLLVYALSQYDLAEFSGMQQWRTNAAPFPQKLKTTGFNALVRHPLYFAGLFIIWGGFLYSPSIKILITALIATLYLYFGTKLEEQKLIVEFGEEYKAYQKKVGMLVPFIK